MGSYLAFFFRGMIFRTMQRKFSLSFSFLFSWASLLALGCLEVRCAGNDGEVLLSHLLNNRMNIILKGTYATDNPLEWREINNNQIFVDSNDDLSSIRHQLTDSCDPDTQADCLPAYDALPIYIDFGGISLSSSSNSLDSVSSEKDSENFWSSASAERQVYCSRYYAANKLNDSCLSHGGLEKFQEFMDGRGSLYPSYDIPNADYIHTGVFVRRIVTGWASEDGELITNTLFDSNRLHGANILLNVSSPPPPTDPNMADNPGPSEWFPLHYRTGSGQTQILHKGFDYLPIVLEIRFNLKENLMLHSYTLRSDDGSTNRRNIVAFSDWRRDHRSMVESNKSGRMGGNVLSRARFFYPHRVSRIDINTTSLTSSRHYFALYQMNESNRDESLPYAATPVRSSAPNQLKHIMPGSYQLECRYDNVHDGYPEERLGSPMDISVPDQPQIISITMLCPP